MAMLWLPTVTSAFLTRASTIYSSTWFRCLLTFGFAASEKLVSLVAKSIRNISLYLIESSYRTSSHSLSLQLLMAYTIRPIPKPVSEEHLTPYIRIRLAMLKANREAFGSTFTRESGFPRVQWRARVDNPARTTFFATTASSTIPDASLASYHVEDGQESKWVGTLSLLGPDLLRGVAFPPKIVEAGDRDADIYMLTGMWVDPEFRKKGVGRQLVEHALRAFIDFSVIDSNQQNTEGNDRRGRILVLEVHNTNFEAQRLYQRQGFVVQTGDTKGDTKWMVLNIR